MSYSNPQTLCYNFPLMDFGAAAGDTLHYIGGPAGKVGRLRDIGVAVSATEAFAGTTKDANVKVGTTADPDAYGQLNIPSGQAASSICNTTVDPNAVISAAIAADTEILITLDEATGTPTGQGHPYVIIDWF